LKTFFTTLFALITVSFLTIPEVEAKRLGGGANLGKQTTMPRQAQPPTVASPQAQRPATAAPTAASAGSSRWLGPLAGLAAGGLLAALFFGGAFEGMTAVDWILIAALALGAFYLFRSMRRRTAVPAAVTSAGRVVLGEAPLGGAGAAGAAGARGLARGTPRDEAPVWFDRHAFAVGAKGHFARLQAAWDEADWQDIATYTTPELLAELQAEHVRSAQAGQRTEVLALDSEVLQVQRDGDQVLASVRFSGQIREAAGAGAQPFEEVWHVQHDWSSRDGDWLIAGIQQVG
jgi:predicted lipid-binding transport protein (Tim44 family)